MKKLIRIMPALLLIALIVNQCANPVADDSPEGVISTMGDTMSDEDRYAQIESLDAGLEDLTQVTLDDSTRFIKNRLIRAMRDLNWMLFHVEKLVESSGDDSAQVVLNEAMAARDSAMAAIEMDSVQLAFEYIRESRDLAREAYKIVKGEEMPTRQEVFEKIVRATHDLDNLLFEVRETLEGSEVPGAGRMFKRALWHRKQADIALYARRLRKAGHHIRESFRYAHFTQWLLDNHPS